MCAPWKPALVFILEYEVWRKDLNFKKISPEKLGISISIFNYGEKHFLVASSAWVCTHMWVWAIVCMRTQAYVNVHLCAYVCLEVGSWYQFFPQCLYLIYRSIVFCWSWSLLIPTLLASQLLWKSSLRFPIVGIISSNHVYYTFTWDLETWTLILTPAWPVLCPLNKASSP